ncbi:ribosome maturation factor RimP [Campylobacterota bacterium]|nr:ribosome maturation factor RimP [Campylobacterota bacterium]
MISAEMFENLVKSAGAELYDTEIVREGGVAVFRVYVDREGGVDVQLCAKISRMLSPIFDADPPVSGAYVLEVSSPGIERKLRTEPHFKAAIGSPVKVTLRDKTRVKGVLKSVENGAITIEEKEPIAIEDIAKAHIIFVPAKNPPKNPRK